MKTFKRTNWTTEEVIELIRGQKLVNSKGTTEGCEAYNEAVENVANMFYDFLRPQEQPGAMAYIVEDKEVVHIGAILPQ